MSTLPPSPFMNPSMPTDGSAVASNPPPVQDATAAPFDSSCSATDAHQSQQCDVRETKRPETDLGIATELQDPESSLTERRLQGAPAGSAPPNTAAPVGALDFDWRAFWDFITDERIVLFEPFDEHPLFVIDGDHLQRWEA